MVSALLLEVLRCPETMQKVRLLDAGALGVFNERIAASEIRTRSGSLRQEPLAGALIREDETLLFPVGNGIPVMLLEEALVLDPKNR